MGPISVLGDEQARVSDEQKEIQALGDNVARLTQQLATVKTFDSTAYANATADISLNSMFPAANTDTQAKCPPGYYVAALTLHWNATCTGCAEAPLHAVTLSCRKLLEYPGQ